MAQMRKEHETEEQTASLLKRLRQRIVRIEPVKGANAKTQESVELSGSSVYVLRPLPETVQRQMDDVFQHGDDLLMSIFAESPIGIYLCDVKGQAILANKACLDIVGISNGLVVTWWPSLFDDPHMPDEAKEALFKQEVVRYQASIDYDELSRHRLNSGTRSGIAFIDILISPLGLLLGGTLTGYMVQLQDITELKQAEHKLRDYHNQLRSLASQLSLAEESERRRLATGLHDEVGQTLAAIKLKLGSLGDILPRAYVDGRLEEIRGLVNEAIQQTRRLTFDLSSPILYELGLEPALEWYVEQFQAKYGISSEFESDGRPKPLGDDVRGLLFQAARELLLNVAKHASAHSVKVHTWRDGESIWIGVEDDGSGFDVRNARWRTRGFGLFNIKERLTAIGGRVEINSDPGHGTTIILVAPLTLGQDTPRG
jgi:signal transduction histidine kinase